MRWSRLQDKSSTRGKIHCWSRSYLIIEDTTTVYCIESTEKSCSSAVAFTEARRRTTVVDCCVARGAVVVVCCLKGGGDRARGLRQGEGGLWRHVWFAFRYFVIARRRKSGGCLRWREVGRLCRSDRITLAHVQVKLIHKAGWAIPSGWRRRVRCTTSLVIALVFSHKCFITCRAMCTFHHFRSDVTEH